VGACISSVGPSLTCVSTIRHRLYVQAAWLVTLTAAGGRWCVGEISKFSRPAVRYEQIAAAYCDAVSFLASYVRIARNSAQAELHLLLLLVVCPTVRCVFCWVADSTRPVAHHVRG
jgi:hypothetical protein